MQDVRIICDTAHPSTKSRITTFVLTYQRFIHAELLTHRVFSRNSASSRAIPTAKYIEMVESNPSMPMEWGKNRPGMQSTELLSSEDEAAAKQIWLDAAKDAVKNARRLAELKAHKQVANRLLEPFLYITTVLTGTEWDNFFALRVHEDAQPEIRELATRMKKLYESESQPSAQHISHSQMHTCRKVSIWTTV